MVLIIIGGHVMHRVLFVGPRYMRACADIQCRGRKRKIDNLNRTGLRCRSGSLGHWNAAQQAVIFDVPWTGDASRKVESVRSASVTAVTNT